MTTRLALVLALAVAPSAAAQLVPVTSSTLPPAPIAQPSDAKQAPVHTLPFGSSGHAVELHVHGARQAVQARVVSAPPWIRLASLESTHEPGQPLAFSFDLAAEAPVGEHATVAVEVLAPDGAPVAQHSVQVVVGAPTELTLDRPYPNPTQGPTTIAFTLPSKQPVQIRVLDALGRRVYQDPGDAAREAGHHAVQLDAANWATGTYFVQLVADDQVALARFTVTR